MARPQLGDRELLIIVDLRERAPDTPRAPCATAPAALPPDGRPPLPEPLLGPEPSIQQKRDE
eukprot:14267199-Alexandrium_andersonii.AAC.1